MLLALLNCVCCNRFLFFGVVETTGERLRKGVIFLSSIEFCCSVFNGFTSLTFVTVVTLVYILCSFRMIFMRFQAISKIEEIS